jgi:hypothetical protein
MHQPSHGMADEMKRGDAVGKCGVEPMRHSSCNGPNSTRPPSPVAPVQHRPQASLAKVGGQRRQNQARGRQAMEQEDSGRIIANIFHLGEYIPPMLSPLLLFALAWVPAQDPAPTPEPATATVVTFASLSAKFETAMTGWIAKMEAMEESEEWEFIPMPAGDFFPKFRALAKDSTIPADDRGQAQIWCLENFGQSGIRWKNPEAAAKGLLNMFLKEFGNSNLAFEILPHLEMMSYDMGAKAVLTLFDEVSEATENMNLRAECLFCQARVLDGEDKSEKAIGLLKDLMKNYPESPSVSKAKGLITKIEGLRIGGTAPNFEGVNVDGNLLSLADYRGKVTYVVFWGFW